MYTYKEAEDFKEKMNEQVMFALHEHPADYALTISPEEGKVVTTFIDLKTKRIAKATCNPKDSMDARLGVAIAWARLQNFKIPSLLQPKERKTLARRMKTGRMYAFPITNEIFSVLAKSYDKANRNFVFTLKKENEYFTLSIGADDFINYVIVK